MPPQRVVRMSVSVGVRVFCFATFFAVSFISLHQAVWLLYRGSRTRKNAARVCVWFHACMCVCVVFFCIFSMVACVRQFRCLSQQQQRQDESDKCPVPTSLFLGSMESRSESESRFLARFVFNGPAIYAGPGVLRCNSRRQVLLLKHAHVI